jgi:hypothetical protein
LRRTIKQNEWQTIVFTGKNIYFFPNSWKKHLFLAEFLGKTLICCRFSAISAVLFALLDRIQSLYTNVTGTNA